MPGITFTLPLCIWTLNAFFRDLPRELEESALVDGCTRMQALIKIVAPLAAPGIISGIIITFVPALGAYLTPDLLGGPDSQMIANVIERQFKRANDWPFGAALSFILMYATFIAIAFQAMKSRQAEARQ